MNLLFDAWERNYITNYYRFLGKMRKNSVIDRYEYVKAKKELQVSFQQLYTRFVQPNLFIVLIGFLLGLLIGIVLEVLQFL